MLNCYRGALYLHLINFLKQHCMNVKNLSRYTVYILMYLYWGPQDANILQKSSPLFSQTNPVTLLPHRSCVVVLHARMIQSVQTSSPFYFGGSYLGEGALPSAPSLLSAACSQMTRRR